jgi:aldehyde dehydrogenase (NAD+)
MQCGKNYIGRVYYEAESSLNKFYSINPSTEVILGEFSQSSQPQITLAVDTAKKAFQSWRKVSRVVRAEYFDTLCQLIKSKKDDLIRCISLETGKTKNESLAEVNEALHMAQYTFGMGRMLCGNLLASEIAEKETSIIRKPKGVVAIITPWNFPFAIAGFWLAAPAILEGNTVVFKPSEDTPMVGDMIAELYDLAGFPPGVFNLIHGTGDIGEKLVKCESVNHICFTGSAETGRKIRQICADSWHKTCSCEMGSKSAVIVCKDANLKMAVNACVSSAFKLSGQRCVSASRIIIEHKNFSEFADLFVNKTLKLKVGDPFEEDVDFGPLINKNQMDKVIRYNEMAMEDEYTQTLLQYTKLDRPGFFLTPHVYTTTWQKPEAREFLKNEVFGPHCAIIPVDDIDEAIAVYNDTDYGLSLAVITEDFRIAKKVQQECDFGLGYWNGGTIAAESHSPFGGVKKSGYGGASAAATFDTVVNKVTWTTNYKEEISFPQGLK